MVYLFHVPAYFILLRETLECTIILAVLLGFIDKLIPDNVELSRRLKRQIWLGTLAGIGISLFLGIIVIVIFYVVATNLWEESEMIWEGIFSLIAAIVISLMAFSMVRVSKWKQKWEGKLKEATSKYLEKHKKGEKWALFFLPFTVVLREALETIVFMAGIGYDKPASGLPIPAITGLLSGILIGFIIYKGSHKMTLNIFFGIMTVFLFFIAAGMFATSIHEFEEYTEHETVVWQVKCCDPKTNHGWDIVKTLFGWRTKATVGTTAGYFTYWAAVIAGLIYLLTKKDAPEEFIGEPADNGAFKDKV